MRRAAHKIVLFANPISGQGLGEHVAADLITRLHRERYAVHPHFQRPAALRSGITDYDAAIVIGGDGTLRDVAAWAIEKMLERGPDATMPPLLVIPMGTANLMGRYLGITGHRPSDLDRIVAALRQPKVVHLDAAQANGSLCLLVAGVGIDGAIVHELERFRRGPITRASYLLPALRALLDYRHHQLRVTVDGRTVFDNQPALAFVGNIPQYGTGFSILPLARPDDGVLDVCIVPCRSFPEMVGMFMLAATGEHLQAEGVVYVKGRHIHIDSPQAVPMQIDGEAAGFTPLDLQLLPTRIPFIVP